MSKEQERGNEAEERARFEKEVIRQCGMTAEEGLRRSDGGKGMYQHISFDHQWIGWKMAREWTAWKEKLAARAASPVSAPTKRMMVTSGGWIHEECPDCRGVCSPVIVHPDECAKYDDGARAVAPVSAEQPTPCTCCNDLAQIAAEFADASRADNEEEQLRHRQRYMGMLSRHITTGHVAAPSVASEDSATQPVPAANNWGIDGHKTTCAFVRYADSCTCGWLAEIERRSLSKQPGSEDWMRKAAALEAILCRVRKIAIERLSLGDRNAILTAADSSAASQLSTEKK